jgi:phage terminase large subunit-like protein
VDDQNVKLATIDEDIEELRETARGDLFVLAKGVLGFDWLDIDIHGPICRLLELYDGWNETLGHGREVYKAALQDKHVRPRLSEAEIGKILTVGLKRLGIVLPRSWLKTTLCSIAYPIWRAVRDPNVRCLLAQNTFKNACSKNKVVKASFESCGMLQGLFPELMPTPKQSWSVESLCVNRDRPWAEGTFEVAGTRTQVTSRHYDVILEDDTIAPDKDDLGEESLMPSKDDIGQAIGWHKLVPPLLLDPMKSQNLIVATRWYVEDLISHVMEKEKGFLWYTRACKEDLKGNPDQNGEVQYAKRFSLEVLEDLEARMGPYLYSCLYLNTPVHAKNMTFQPGWISESDTWPRSLLTYTSVDPAGVSEDPESDTDYNVVMTTGKDPLTGRIHVLEYYRERCVASDLIQAIFDHVRRWHPIKVKVETIAYQSTLKYTIEEMMLKLNFFFMLETIPHHDRAKPARIRSLQPIFAAKAIFIRPHMTALRNELLAYPFSRHDDLLDALSMQLDMWHATPRERQRPVKTYEDDPLSVEAAITSLETRRKSRPGLPAVMDIGRVNDVLVMN